jgi:DNA-binding MarR family transcriptional regulator
MTAQQSTPEEVAVALRLSVGLLVRRLRQVQGEGELTLPETAVLARLDRGGATTASALAKLERISPQSMGATLTALESRGLIGRRADPRDGRQALIHPTKEGLRRLRDRRNERVERMARVLETDFTRTEVRQLMAAAPLLERVAQGI